MFSWINRQKIGTRITIGFGFIVGLFIVSAFIALTSFGNTLLNLTEYRENSNNVQLILRVDERLLNARLHAVKFRERPTDSYKETALASLKEAQELIKKIDSRQFSDTQKEALHLASIQTDLYQQYIQDLVTNETAITEQTAKLAALGTEAVSFADQLGDSTREAKDTDATFLLGAIRKTTLLGRLYTQKFITTENQEEVNQAKTYLATDVPAMLSRVPNIKTDALKVKFNELGEKIAAYTSEIDTLIKLIEESKDIETNRMNRSGAQIEDSIEIVGTEETKMANSKGNSIVLSTRLSFILMVLVTACGAVLSFIGMFWLTRNIVRPMTKIINLLSSATSQVTAASSQISAASTQLSAGATQQAASIEETSATMEEMGAQALHNAEASKSVLESVKGIANLIEANAQKALDAAQISEQSKVSAERGETSINDISNSMNEIRQGSEQITNIISTINDIAQQTKMLAVNAAIEAARAGEHGQGFAVVADQVSKLAETSKTAAKEIEMLIRESVHKAESGTHVATKGTDAIREILTRIQEISNLIGQITTSSQQAATFIQDVKNQTSGITEAAQQGSEGIAQVTNAIQQIDQVTQQNSAAAEETSSAAQELHAQANAMSDVVNELNIMITGMDIQGKRRNVREQETESFADTSKLVMRAAKIKSKKLARTVQAKTRRPLPQDLAYETPHPQHAAAVSPEDIIPMRADFSDFQEDAATARGFELK